MEEIKVISSIYKLGAQKVSPETIASEIVTLAKQIENNMQENSFAYAVWMSLQRIKSNYRPEDYLLIFDHLSSAEDWLTKPLIYQICIRGCLYERSEKLMTKLYARATKQGLGPGPMKDIKIALLWLRLRDPNKFEAAELELNQILEV